MSSYTPHTPEDRQEMLAAIGVSSIEELLAPIDPTLRAPESKLADGVVQMVSQQIMEDIAEKNVLFSACFLGAGYQKHYIPPVVSSLASREEFVTAYTPYQAEVSQGVLQAIFEYQTMICRLTGMDVSNASVYDGATAASEVVAMCLDRKKTKAIVSATVNPQTLEVLATWCSAHETELIVVPEKDGVTDIDGIKAALDKQTAVVITQNPNFYGIVEPCSEIAEAVHEMRSAYAISCDPISLALYKSPAELGADIAFGEGQSLGTPISFGGPGLGYMAATKRYMRKLPGRIVGQTVDTHGNRGFVLTLQAREQHIRRDKASSNICSNQALNALTACIYLSSMGPFGLEEVATLCIKKAHWLKDELTAIDGIELLYDKPFYNEFITTHKDPDAVLSALNSKGILGGLKVDDAILWCVTEINTIEQMKLLIETVKEVG